MTTQQAVRAVADVATFQGPAAWRGSKLAESTEWIEVLSAAQKAEIIAIGRKLESDGATLVDARTFARLHPEAMPTLLPLLFDIREILRVGRGFTLMRGFPVAEMSPTAIRLAYAAIGSVLGVSMPQNKKGELIHDVRDTGADRKDPNVRLSITNAEQDFHTDAADIIGLICLQKAKSGGVSRIVSSVSVYNEIATARPDLAPMLFQPWYFHLKGEQPAGAPPYFRLPISQVINGHLSTFFIAWYIRDAELLDGVPKLAAAQHELLKLYERTANRPDLYLDMHFEPGDVQWLKNSVILHKRTEYVDWPEPERKRHLMRLWLAAPDFADGIVAIRQGHQASAS